MHALGTLAPQSLTVVPWPDAIIDRIGHHPRSLYVETYWLAILGPSTTWLHRHLVAELEISPRGTVLSLLDTARRLGLGDGVGRSSPFRRAFLRLEQFDLAIAQGETRLAVRLRVPPLPRRHLHRLPESLQRAHDMALQAHALEAGRPSPDSPDAA